MQYVDRLARILIILIVQPVNAYLVCLLVRTANLRHHVFLVLILRYLLSILHVWAASQRVLLAPVSGQTAPHATSTLHILTLAVEAASQPAQQLTTRALPTLVTNAAPLATPA